MLTRSSWRLILALLLLVVFTVWSAFLFTDPRLHVYVFDVGQGDSILLQSGSFEVLVDGGPDTTIVNHLGRILPPWDRTIELVVLSHPHADHLIGLVEVIKRYAVQEVWGTGIVHTSKVYADFLTLIRDKAIPYQAVSAGETRSVTGINLAVLAPTKKLAGERLDNANLSSIILKATYGRFAILLTGDAEEPVQEGVIKAGFDLTADVLKVPHQGSRDSDSPAFLNAVHPAYAIISVGKDNQYGHPHTETLRHYAALGIPILRTDQDGTVSLISDGQILWIKTAKTGIVSKMELEDGRVGAQ